MIENSKLILGFDEVGRGPLAGPVVVSCVLQNLDVKIPTHIIIKDSKKMTKIQREMSDRWIRQNYKYGIGKISATAIDQIGINQAIIKAANLALEELHKKFSKTEYQIIIDGKDKWFPDCATVIKGEDKYQEIAMASIIAKVYRDNLMTNLKVEYPDWNFEKHVGYGTVKHREMIANHGLILGLHRKSFCRKIHLDSK